MSRASAQVSQNCDNFLNERSSTRLHHAPGGGSSFSTGLTFGGNDTSAITKPVKRDPNARSEDMTHGFRAKGSNAHANGANQNCGNVLTDRPTSRVLNAPGGGSAFGAGLTFGGNDTSAITKPVKRDPNARSEDMTHGFRAKGSNAHANGANQNCGNVLTDRPTSRVLNAPGGGSAFGAGLTFGGNDTSAITKPVKRDPNARSEDMTHGFRAKGSNAHANGANQNCGNVLTDRPTSRVLNAPGGGSAFGAGLTFGGDDTAEATETIFTAAATTAVESAAPAAEPAKAPLTNVTNALADTGDVVATKGHGFRAKGSNAHANGANQNCGNFLTDRPTSRVLAPPGGGSQVTFG